jgi:hypothetical protein
MTDSVRVNAADFNGESWDGSPFDSFPQWLHDAVLHGRVEPKADDRDYALFSVLTDEGRVIAEPDDRIERLENGSLTVRKFDPSQTSSKPTSDRM